MSAPARPLPPQVQHGSVNAYDHYRCRCMACRAAKYAANEEAARRRVGRPYKEACECGLPLVDGACPPCDAKDAQWWQTKSERPVVRENAYDADGWWKNPARQRRAS